MLDLKSWGHALSTRDDARGKDPYLCGHVCVLYLALFANSVDDTEYITH